MMTWWLWLESGVLAGAVLGGGAALLGQWLGRRDSRGR